MNPPLIINLGIFIALLLFIAKIGAIKKWNLSKQIFLGLVTGIIFGLGLQLVYGSENLVLQESILWFNIVGNGYVNLLQMVVIPLVFVSILSAVVKLPDTSLAISKISVLTIGTLLFTTAIAALIGIFVTHLFDLTAEGLVQGSQENARLSVIKENYLHKVTNLHVPELILSFIPKNPFADFTGASPTSIISIVIFTAFLGTAVLQLLKEDREKGQKILQAIDILQAWVMKLIKLIIKLTPYGIMALMTKIVASSNAHDILKLGSFAVASYLGLAMILIVHALLLSLTGINPVRFFKKIWPVLTFAFTSRSSAASIPLNIETQVRSLGIPASIASFSASFGATIGQNGCAGLYPAMLAVMVAPTVGINPFDIAWIITLVGITTLSSAGVAGVGGGATFAALIVLPALNLPVTLVALLISIEPLIDMGRTALNVSGAMTAGTITSQLMKQTDQAIFNNDETVTLTNN